MSASEVTSLTLMSAWSISDCDLRLTRPVDLRKRWARRSRIFGDEVSGRKTNIIKQMGADSQRSSHANQCQPMGPTLKPAIIGARAGPIVTEPAHKATRYGILIMGYISWNVAAPVARHGDPKNPAKNRRTNSPAKLSTSAVGICRMTKMTNVDMYIGFRPMTGILSTFVSSAHNKRIELRLTRWEERKA